MTIDNKYAFLLIILFQETFGVNMLAGDYKNGVLTCKFERRVNMTTGSTSDDSRFFDLKNQYFLLIAHGTANEGKCKKLNKSVVIVYTVSAPSLTQLGNISAYHFIINTQMV